MTPEQRIAIMTKAINEAIKILGNRFGSTDGDHERTIKLLKEALNPNPAPAVPAPPTPAAPPS
jgi:hypothetical protein